MTPAELDSLLAADLSDQTTRLVLSDALTDLCREEEVALCRDLSRRIRAADFGPPSEGEPPLGRRVIDFDHTWVEWVPDDAGEARHVRGPWEESISQEIRGLHQARFMLWYNAGELRPGRSREGWETAVLYLCGRFAMSEAHERLFRDTVRAHAVSFMMLEGRTWAIEWPDGVIEQEPQPLALVAR